MVFAAGVYGAARELAVSPMHRMLITDWRADLMFGDSEVLMPAHHLVNVDTVTRRNCDSVTYVHLIFDAHEVIFAEGVASESFYPKLDAVGTDETRQELLEIYPDLASTLSMALSRRCLRGYESAILALA